MRQNGDSKDSKQNSSSVWTFSQRHLGYCVSLCENARQMEKRNILQKTGRKQTKHLNFNEEWVSRQALPCTVCIMYKI